VSQSVLPRVFYRLVYYLEGEKLSKYGLSV
jgi:hypothetical protein